MIQYGSGAEILEWVGFDENNLFYRWPVNEIKKNSEFIIRQNQHLIILADGQIDGLFKFPGHYNFLTQIVPDLLTRNSFYKYNPDSNMPAEVYFINARDFHITWQTRPKVLIITPDTPSGIPVGVSGSFRVEYKDYLNFINRTAGLRDSYMVDDIALRIRNEINPVIINAILDGQQTGDINRLIKLSIDNESLAGKLSNEFSKRFNMQGLNIIDFKIESFDYPDEINKLADKSVVRHIMKNIEANNSKKEEMLQA